MRPPQTKKNDLAVFRSVEIRSPLYRLTNYYQIRNAYFNWMLWHEARGQNAVQKNFFDNQFYPFLTEEEKQLRNRNTYTNYFSEWTKAARNVYKLFVDEGTLMRREEEKEKQQIKIRQDATEMMGDFLTNIKEIASKLNSKNVGDLKKLGINPTSIYEIIRKEEDRAKELRLKEREQNRADAQFAFFVSMVKANELAEGDIEFLEADVRQELLDFKKQDGTYKLTIRQPQMAELQSASEDFAPQSDEGVEEGSA